MTLLGKGRTCGWCGKPGGTCSSMLKARCDRAGVKLQGESQRYFHGGSCTTKVRAACEKAERAAGTIAAPVRYR